MPKNESIEFFKRTLTERLSDVRGALDKFLAVVSVRNIDEKKAAAQVVLDAIISLKGALSSSDRPPWIRGLEKQFTLYIRSVEQNDDAGRVLLRAILSVYADIEKQ